MDALREFCEKQGYGQYPPEYNKKVHGRYDPGRFYGKPDTPLAETKISELGAWFGRRNKTPRAVIQSVSRAMWRWNHGYFQPRRCSAAGLYQFLVAACAFSYVINYSKKRYHVRYRYH